ncbi:TolB family protein [Clostridium sp. LBM24168]
MKNSRISLFVKISVPVLIIGGSLGIEKFMSAKSENLLNKTMIVMKKSPPQISDSKLLEIENKKSYGNIKGLSENFGFINDDEILVGIGIDMEEFKRKYPQKINESNYSAENDISGIMYKLKLSNLEKKSLEIDTNSIISNISPNSDKVIYVKNGKELVYDLNGNSKVDYRNDDVINKETWSEDGNYLMSYYDGYIKLYNVNTKSSKKLKIKAGNLWIDIIPSFYSKNGRVVYFIGGQFKNKNNLKYKRQGIFKIDTEHGNIQEVFTLPYNNSNDSDHSKYSGIELNDYCVLDDGKKIILNATINGQDGVYIYDTDTKKFYNVVMHTVKSKESSYASPIWVSPDRTKVVYMNVALENGKEQWNLYASKINGNNLTGKICIYKNINISASLNNSLKWSKDSKKILFFTYNKLIKENGFEFSDENLVNIITFK